MENYSVYEHIFPNGKRYIGITSVSPEHRWNKGYGYVNQKKVFNAIKKYGWENIEHNIIAEGLTKKQAEDMEMRLIDSFDAISNGYNASIGGENATTSFLCDDLLRRIRNARKLLIPICPVTIGDKTVSMPAFVRMAKYDKETADFWNVAHEAVLKKHPNESEDFRFYWNAMREFLLLHLAILAGEDVSEWHERSVGEVAWEIIDGTTKGSLAPTLEDDQWIL